MGCGLRFFCSCCSVSYGMVSNYIGVDGGFDLKGIIFFLLVCKPLFEMGFDVCIIMYFNYVWYFVWGVHIICGCFQWFYLRFKSLF